jgi:hypothetical protein
VQPPAPEPKVEAAPTLPSKPDADPKPEAPRTVPEERRAVALAVRSGSLSAQVDGRWTKAVQPEEGTTLRAEGRTVCEFAQARLTLEGTSKVSFEGNDVALQEGGLAAEVPLGSRLTIVVLGHRVEPQVSAGRALILARPDRVVVDEGSARVGGLVLGEGVEHAVRKDGVEAQRRRTLGSVPRPREATTWRLEFKQPETVRLNLNGGRLVWGREERMIASEPSEEGGLHASRLSYYAKDDRVGLFTLRPTTALRFRYFLTRPAYTELVLWNITKSENFNKPFEAVVGRWTTMTLPVREIPVNPGGLRPSAEPGDRYRSVGWFVGRPGSDAEFFVDRLEIVEIER